MIYTKRYFFGARKLLRLRRSTGYQTHCNITSTEGMNITMEITDLKIRKMMTDGRLRAIVSITLDQMLAVHDIKVVQGESRLFVAMPSRKDEGGIFLSTIQSMLMQYEGDKIFLLPAWPKDWNCDFKLHAPKNTTIEGRVENGELKDLVVTPASRRADLQL